MDIENAPQTSSLAAATDQIEHLVLSGGSIYVYSMYAVLRELFLHQYLNLTKIKTIYGTSCGAMVSVMIGLKYDWHEMDKYILSRPMDMYKIDIYRILQLHKKTGIFSKSAFEILLSSLFLAKNLTLDMTLEEFYQYNGIEIHMFATQVNGMHPVDISYKTHPSWKVIEAVYASCAIPVIFEPFLKDGNIYCDGFIFRGYPLQPCLQNEVVDYEKVLSIQCKNTNLLDKDTENDPPPMIYLTDYMNIFFQYLYKFYLKYSYECLRERKVKDIIIEQKLYHLYDFNKVVSIESRKTLFQYGLQVAREFLDGLERKDSQGNKV
jgi:predicted acylesterase/phospholipase RssA